MSDYDVTRATLQDALAMVQEAVEIRCGYLDAKASFKAWRLISRADARLDDDRKAYDYATRAAENTNGVGWVGLREDVENGYVTAHVLVDTLQQAIRDLDFAQKGEAV